MIRYFDIETRLKAITPGQWWLPAQPSRERVAVCAPDGLTQPKEICIVGTAMDAEFIAHAPADIAALLKALREQEDAS